MKKLLTLSVAAMIGVFSANVNAENNKKIEPVKLSGFRIGASYLGGAKATEMRDALGDSTAAPMISQFGWQQEVLFPAGDNGTVALVEFIGLLGGFDQGIIVPSLNIPIGIRSASGYEIGAGPHISMGRVGNEAKLSTGFVVAGGKSFEVGQLNIPVNFAYMHGRAHDSSNSGYTLTLLSGFAF